MVEKRFCDLGERSFIDRISRIIGLIDHDDCAVIDAGDNLLVATTDMLHLETDFPSAASAWQIGWMSVAVNLSDIAAMGARPIGVLLAVGLPGDTDLEFSDELFRGFYDCARSYQTAILGGDTDCHKELTITGTALGRVDRDKILRRRGARPGDLLCTTGTLGDAGAGLNLLLSKECLQDRYLPLVRRLLEPFPRLLEGEALAACGAVTAMMDNSDGLALSLYDLQRAGGTGFQVDLEKVPISWPLRDLAGFGADLQDLILYSGGDFELLFTVQPQMLSEAKRACDLTVIGFAVDEGMWFSCGDERRPLQPRGFSHL